MSSRLYVYYRVPEAALATTVAAVRAVQARLVQEHPGLRAELLRRPEQRDGEVTLMETYAGGLSAAVRDAIARASNALPQPRHSEIFEPLPGCPEGPEIHEGHDGP